MIICITGLPGAGKSEVAEILHKKGYGVFEMGSVVKEMMKNEDIEITPNNLEAYSTSLRARRGKIVYAEETVERLKGKLGGDVVISGLRNYEEVEYFKKQMDDFVVIAVIAPEKLRFERLKTRKIYGTETYSDFKVRDDRNKQFGMNIVIERADYTIVNEGSLKNLEKETERILTAIKTKKK